MSTDPAKDKKYVPISEAARILGVSIATVRRWDKKGILHAIRRSGRYRYFTLDELEKVKFSQPLTISQAAHQLGLSATTLRRLERRGVIKPDRNDKGERIYTRKCLKSFLDSEYYLNRRKVEEKILEPFKAHEQDQEKIKAHKSLSASDNGGSDEDTEHRLLAAETYQNKKLLNALVRSKRYVISAGVFITTVFVLIIATLTALFLIWPEDTGSFLGYYSEPKASLLTKSSGNNSPEDTLKPHVLGVQVNREERDVLSSFIYPFSQVSLQLVRLIDVEKYYRAVPEPVIRDIQDIFTITNEGNLTLLYKLQLPDSTYLSIPDGAISTIKNLDADYLRGRAPGLDPGNIVFLNEEGNLELFGLLVSPSVGTQAIIDGAVTEEKIAEGVLDSFGLEENSITTVHIVNGEVKTADIANTAVTAIKIASSAVNSAKIKDGSVAAVDLADGAVTSGKISDGTILTADLADGAITTAKIADGTIGLSDLNDIDAAGDEECLTYETDSGAFEWQTCSSGTFNSFTLSGDNGTDQTLEDGNTLEIAGGNGLTTTAGATDTLTVAIDLLNSDDGTGGTSSNSGLEFQGSSTDELTMLQGCSDTQVLKWDDTNKIWECAADAGASSASLQAAYDTGGSITTSDARDIDFVLDDTATDSNFDIDIATGSTSTVTISRAAGAGTSNPAQLLKLEDLDADLIIADGLLIQSAGTLTDAIDVSDAQIINALNIGANTFRGTTAVIDFTDFDVSAIGSITAQNTSAVHIFGAAASFELPNSDTPTVDANGEIAFDNTVTDFTTGVLRVYGSDEEQGIVALPIAQFTSPTDNFVVSYNATNDEFELTAKTTDTFGQTTFTLAGDTGSETIADGNTITATGGTGVTTAVTATDIITFSFDCSEVEGTDIDCAGESITLETTLDSVTTINLAGTSASITGATAVIDFTDFDVSADGLI
ncbi:MerR family DNA-binding transcriptional regulator, partial [Patescibacteria group bacterium]|nr:MerR family DNA-binding transcriptional regulator [Patescibacteria group bacterium]